MKITYNTFSVNINKLIKNNKSAKTREARTAVVSKHRGMLNQLINQSENIPVNKPNRFHYLVDRLNNWILNGKGDKDYKTKSQLKNAKDQPATINDNIDTSSRIYKNNNNYYSDKKGDLKPTQSELTIHSIRQAADNVKDLQLKLKNKNLNRFVVSKNIRRAKDDLNEIIKGFRGINHSGRIDNTITPDNKINTPGLNDRTYKVFLLTNSLNELHNENVRLDKMDLDNALGSKKDLVFKALEQGYNQAEISKLTGLNQSTISRKINKTIRTPISE